MNGTLKGYDGCLGQPALVHHISNCQLVVTSDAFPHFGRHRWQPRNQVPRGALSVFSAFLTIDRGREGVPP